jgi:hypothetical protein
MIHITEEGGVIRNGFNFYPIGDKGSCGFRFRYGSKIFWLRYSKVTKQLTVGS